MPVSTSSMLVTRYGGRSVHCTAIFAEVFDLALYSRAFLACSLAKVRKADLTAASVVKVKKRPAAVPDCGNGKVRRLSFELMPLRTECQASVLNSTVGLTKPIFCTRYAPWFANFAIPKGSCIPATTLLIASCGRLSISDLSYAMCPTSRLLCTIVFLVAPDRKRHVWYTIAWAS